MNTKKGIDSFINRMKLFLSEIRSSQTALLSESGFFDYTYFLDQCLTEGVEVPKNESALLSVYLRNETLWGIKPSSMFDGAWYLDAYPDVRHANIHPLIHYIRYGKKEGRQPVCNRALAWEFYLWRGGEDIMLRRLDGLLNGSAKNNNELSYSCWALARWYAYKQDWDRAVYYILSFEKCSEPSQSGIGPWLIGIQSALESGSSALAAGFLNKIKAASSNCTDLYLAESNIKYRQLDARAEIDAKRLSLINAVFQSADLNSIMLSSVNKSLNINNLTSTSQHVLHYDKEYAKVSVIVPMYNAQKTIISTLTCLKEQSWRNLEVIVVDDCSTDISCDLVASFIAALPLDIKTNWVLLRQTQNKGAYAARNKGAAYATGDFITVHDADDWSHSQKIEKQVCSLLQSHRKIASISFLARVNAELEFTCWRIEEKWIYRNISSLMIRRSVLNEIGFWDDIRAGADTEYYYRLLSVYGDGAIIEVLPDVPLSFLLSSQESLTQQPQTHLITQFLGIRKLYLDAALRWHHSAGKKSDLFLSAEPKARPFLIPQGLNGAELEVENMNPINLVQQSGWFDQAWYIQNNSDLHNQMKDPIEHYWENQFTGERDPGPSFSQSGYLYQMKLKGIPKIEPLKHFLCSPEGERLEPLPFFAGRKKRDVGKATILLVGHALSKSLYGAERSLLDLVVAFSKLGYNVLISLPNATNTDYIEKLKQYSLGVGIIPDGWWLLGKKECNETILNYQKIFMVHNVDFVHVNTLVQDNILTAAKNSGLKIVVHIREFLEGDEALSDTLNVTPIQGYERIFDVADLIIANSQFMGKSLQDKLKKYGKNDGRYPPIKVIQNIIDTSKLLNLALNYDCDTGAVNVVMISSNIAKKGVWDFIELAKALEGIEKKAQFKLFGPRTQEIEKILNLKTNGKLSNVDYCGYVDDPVEALSGADIVVNLSHFQESFGRTVLEAMAAAKPVVCYDWGALSELVVDKQSGYLVSFGDVSAVSSRIVDLINSPELRMKLAEAGRTRAMSHYSESIFETKLYNAYAQLSCSNIL